MFTQDCKHNWKFSILFYICHIWQHLQKRKKRAASKLKESGLGAKHKVFSFTWPNMLFSICTEIPSQHLLISGLPTFLKDVYLCTSQCKPRPPDPRDIAGDVTFLQCYISTFTPALGGIWTVTIPAPRAPVSKALRALPSRGVWGHAPPENFEILYSQRRIFLHSEALNGKYETCWKHGNLSLYWVSLNRKQNQRAAQ